MRGLTRNKINCIRNKETYLAFREKKEEMLWERPNNIGV
jgi:hypothetical protein